MLSQHKNTIEEFLDFFLAKINYPNQHTEQKFKYLKHNSTNHNSDSTFEPHFYFFLGNNFPKENIFVFLEIKNKFHLVKNKNYKYLILGFSNDQLHQITNLNPPFKNIEELNYNAYFFNDNFKIETANSLNFKYLFELGLFELDFFNVSKIRGSLT